MQPTAPLYWRSRRELPTGLLGCNQSREAHVPPKRSRAQGIHGTLSGWPVYLWLTALDSHAGRVQGISAYPRHALLTASHAPRGASIPCALTRLRILPVATGVDYSLRQFRNRGFFLCVSVPLWQIPFCLSFVFTTIRIAFPATPLFSQPSALPGGCGVCRQGFHRCQVRVARRTGI